MSLDGALLHCVKEELSALIGARVDKIYQPSREEIVLSLRKLGSADRSAKKLIFSANGTAARVHLTEAEFDNPAQPPMFCMLMRKHLGGGRLVDIRQDGLERILYFDFECTSEIGDEVTNTLICEIMGRHSNIILAREKKILDSIKHVSDVTSAVRRVLPNLEYEAPPRAERLNILEADSAEILKKIAVRTDRLAKALPDILEGISPVFARECAYFAAGDVDIGCAELSSEQREWLAEFLTNALKGSLNFTMLTDETGKKKDICFVDIGQYGSAMSVSHFDSANALLDSFFAEDGSRRSAQRARELMKTLNSVYERALRKQELRKKELADCENKEQLKIIGDLINANIYRLEKGMTQCSLEDFYGGGEREIQLDARLTPAQNAQKYYSEYRKQSNAEKKLAELIDLGAAELRYLDSIFDCVSRAETDAELSEIKRELTEQGYLRGAKVLEKQKKLSEPLRYISSDGYEILVGKNNRQNDLLTLKTAKASDLWLHVKDIAGSHVIVKNNGGDLPERTVFEAAQLAAFHSKGRESSGVPVDCTLVRFVKKPAGAKPGMVIFTNNKTLFVTPDKDLINKLKDN